MVSALNIDASSDRRGEAEQTAWPDKQTAWFDRQTGLTDRKPDRHTALPDGQTAWPQTHLSFFKSLYS